MRFVPAIALAVSLATTAAVAADPTILTGTVTHLRDGDTIEVGNIPIRLNGVSAPELKEPLGPQSKQFMRVMAPRCRYRRSATVQGASLVIAEVDRFRLWR